MARRRRKVGARAIARRLRGKRKSYIGFKRLPSRLRKRGVRRPKALAAWIGRAKYGKKRFQKMAAKGRRRRRRR